MVGDMSFFRGYPSLEQGVHAFEHGTELVTSGTLFEDRKMTGAVADTIIGTVFNLILGAPDVFAAEAEAGDRAKAEQAASGFFDALENKRGDLEAQSQVSHAAADGLGDKFNPAAIIQLLMLAYEIWKKWRQS